MARFTAAAVGGAVAFAAVLVTAFAVTATTPRVPKSNPAALRSAQHALNAAPVAFERGSGRLPRGLDFLARGPGHTLAVGPGRSVVAVRGGAVTTTLVGATPAPGRAERRLPGVINDFSAGVEHLPTYGRVRYRGVYDGIDLLYHGRSQALEYDFAVAPGADPAQIRFAIAGGRRPRLDANGNLVLAVGRSEVVQRRPVAIQDGRRVPARFVLDGRSVRFAVGDYDHGRPLTIDPVIAFGDYVGGTNNDQLNDVAVGPDGGIYAIGITYSPSIPGFSGTVPSSQNRMIAMKFDPDGSRKWESFFGTIGTNSGGPSDLAIDGGGNLIVAGDVYQPSGGSADTTASAFDTTAEYREAFVGRFNSSDGTRIYLTYFGGGSFDYGFDVAADRSGDAYLTGQTNSSGLATVGDTSLNADDAYVAKFSPTGTRMFATYMGGSGTEVGRGIGVAPTCDSACDIFVGGETESTDFPTVAPNLAAPGGIDGVNDVSDLFGAHLDSTGATVLWATYVDIGDLDDGTDMTVDQRGYPTLAGRTDVGNDSESFLYTFFPPSGTQSFKRMISGNGTENVYHVASDALNNLYAVGNTTSSNFLTVNEVQSDLSGGTDGFALKVKPSGGVTVWSTYLGGTAGETATGIAPDNAGGTWIVGSTGSSDFPTNHPTQGVGGGFSDGFIAKLELAPVAILTGPSGPSRSADAAFTYHSDEGNRAYQCRLGPAETAFTACPGTGKAYTGLAEGSYTFDVRILDTGGTTDGKIASRAFDVNLHPDAQFTVAPNPVLVGRPVTFDASKSTAAATIAKYEWDLDGDGKFETDTGTTATATASYPSARSITTSLRVTDANGLSSTATAPLQVNSLSGASQFGVTINKGAQYTRSPNVIVSANFPPSTSTMLFSNDGGFLAPTTFQPQSEVKWLLDSSGPERLPKQIYVRFLSGPITSETYQDDIILDETPPKVDNATVAPATAAAARSASAARLRTWKVKVKATDSNSGVSKLQITSSKRKPGPLLAYKTRLKVKSKARPKWIRARDRAGNLSKWKKAR